ncbi:MAG TPA: cytochrome c oxidase assembly protein [Longimicrobiaceae bacterium]|nr:cytochrome c oxidase assembly protein [Longimicrobiaceae bacterium]
MLFALIHSGTFSWSEWKLYPSFMVGWLILGGVYFLLCGPLRRYFPGSQRVSGRQLLLFTLGMLLMLVSLQGPLHELSDYFLFSAHMVQHLLIILMVPPLLLAGTPGWMLRPAIQWKAVRKVAAWLTLPIVAFALNNAIFLGWHFPGPYDLMMRNHDVHVAMHLMIMAAGVIMWWPVMSPLPELPRIAPPLQMIYLFVLGIPMMVTAALITFSADPMYQWYVEAPRMSSLSALEDQRLGGAIMWVPGALVIWIAITAVYFRWSRSDREIERREANARPAVTRAGMVAGPPPFPKR